MVFHVMAEHSPTCDGAAGVPTSHPVMVEVWLEGLDVHCLLGFYPKPVLLSVQKILCPWRHKVQVLRHFGSC